MEELLVKGYPMERKNTYDCSSVSVPEMPEALLMEAYENAATRSILAAVNNDIFFGYFSACADGKGYGSNSTFPGLDWGQTAEALLWLGREDLVRASWEYVKSFQRNDGLLPFAIFPSEAGTTIAAPYGHPLTVEPNGAIFRHWVPGNPFRTLAPITFIQVADAIFRYTGDNVWLDAQARVLKLTVRWLEQMTDAEGRVGGGGFYLERPTRLEYDGVNQCYSAHACHLAAALFDVLGDHGVADQCRSLATRIVENFREEFWNGNQFIEYIHPQRGRISGHGLTDVDWIAVATGAANHDQIQILWKQLRNEQDFIYSGMPTGIATRPETYEDWEVQSLDRHDIAAMGRVWYIESWVRAEMGDGDGLVASLLKVAAAGKDNDWYWRERYYSERTPDLLSVRNNTYVEYPACLIRVVNKFLFGVKHGLDGSLSIAPIVPDHFWEAGFGQTLTWATRTLTYRFHGNSMEGTYFGAGPQRLNVRLPPSTSDRVLQAQVNGHPAQVTRCGKQAVLDLPLSLEACSFSMHWASV